KIPNPAFRSFEQPKIRRHTSWIKAATANYAGITQNLIAHGIGAAAGLALPIGMDAVGSDCLWSEGFGEKFSDHELTKRDFAEPRVVACAAHFPTPGRRIDTDSGVKYVVQMQS